MFWSTNSFKSFCVHGWGAQIDVIFFCFFFRCMTYKTWTSIKRREFFSFDYNTFFLYIEIIDWKINNLISHKHLTSEFVNCPWRYNPRQMIIFHSGMAKYYRFIIACAPYRLPKFRETSTLVSSIFFFFFIQGADVRGKDSRVLRVNAGCIGEIIRAAMKQLRSRRAEIQRV